MKITMRIYCLPKAQKRARSRAINLPNGKSFAQIYKDSGQRLQEENLQALLYPHAPEQPFKGPIRFFVAVYLPIPKSKPKKWKEAALAGSIRPTTKPDNSNLVKHLEDVMNGTFWVDDKQIISLEVHKHYGQIPGYYLEIEEL